MVKLNMKKIQMNIHRGYIPANIPVNICGNISAGKDWYTYVGHGLDDDVYICVYIFVHIFYGSIYVYTVF